ncbi:Methionine gamma-lyase [hydrothermal vent metagenome]|uniref:Methionine gamma-lyase n=1 Tax=hydrothermal vent metagenome TaxID=652676 RepID=A0A3B0S0C6_9ZZZZ
MTKLAKPYCKRTIGNHQLKPESLAMGYGYDPALSEGSIKPPVFQTSTFVFKTAEHGAAYFRKSRGQSLPEDMADPGLAYTRINNPNLEVLEDRLTLFDGGEDALAFSSGMGAITTTLMALAVPGSVFVYSSPLYGPSEMFLKDFLPRFGIKSISFAADASSDEVRETFDKAREMGEIAVIYVETPANPTNAIVDLDLCVTLANEVAGSQAQRPVVISDNTMQGPIGQTPLITSGLDLVVYSITKYIGGHSDLIAGAAIGSADVIARIRALRTVFGTVPDPHTCWLVLRSLETLKLRVNEAAKNAKICAEFLRDHPKVAQVRYLGFLDDDPVKKEIFDRTCLAPGSTFSFDLKDGQEAAFGMLNHLQLIKLAVSLGGTESLMCHPASTTHSGVPEEMRRAQGYTDGLIRFSVGIENPDDLLVDLEQALSFA